MIVQQIKDNEVKEVVLKLVPEVLFCIKRSKKIMFSFFGGAKNIVLKEEGRFLRDKSFLVDMIFKGEDIRLLLSVYDYGSEELSDDEWISRVTTLVNSLEKVRY